MLPVQAQCTALVAAGDLLFAGDALGQVYGLAFRPPTELPQPLAPKPPTVDMAVMPQASPGVEASEALGPRSRKHHHRVQDLPMGAKHPGARRPRRSRAHRPSGRPAARRAQLASCTDTVHIMRAAGLFPFACV